MMNQTPFSSGFLILALVCAIPLLAASARGQAPGKLKVAVVKNESEGPKYMAEGGLIPMLEKLHCEAAGVETVTLTQEEQAEYGAWNRAALENRRLGSLVSKIRQGDGLIIGLLTSCTDLLGMLAGLQQLRPAENPPGAGATGPHRQGLAGAKPLRVGLFYFDAHADFNTPETTLSGMLGGMDVAVASGMCLTRLRLKVGLDPALPTKYIVFGGLRDVDPLEQELLDRSDCASLSVEDIRGGSDALGRQLERLAGLVDVIYIHVDMDVLDPAEVSGHPMTAPEGPKSAELASVVRTIFSHPKAVALGIASIPFGARDKDGLSLRASYRLIEAAILGMKAR
jgi:arginase